MEMESAHRDDDLSPEAARMLREMALRGREEGVEPDLSDEQLRSNYQLQQDEMLALEAIFGDKICIFGEKAGPRSFQVKLFKLVHRVPGISNYHRHTKIMILVFPFSIICRFRCIVKFQMASVYP
uniref:Uncharacterized protein n=1 Tax=Triticum urartu TaxID=4572 RepID=A0A8R7TM75_TRIUA